MWNQLQPILQLLVDFGYLTGVFSVFGFIIFQSFVKQQDEFANRRLLKQANELIKEAEKEYA